MRNRLDRVKIFRQSRMRRRRRPIVGLVFLIVLIILIPVVSVYLINMSRKNDQTNAANAAKTSDQQFSETLEAVTPKDGDGLSKCNKNHIENLETYVGGEAVSVERVLVPEKDEQPPEITLNGAESQTLAVGTDYEEQGASVVDNCDEVEVEIIGEVNTKVAGTYKVTYRSTDKSGNTAEKIRTVKIVSPANGDSVIYLTFDDGPGAYTGMLLDVLKKYDVKATFFVTGFGDDSLIAREHNEGHAVALHTFSHDYSYVYTSVDNFFNDLYKVQERVKNITGETSMLMRFPGGSSNLISKRYDGGTRIMSTLANEVTARGFTYFDWNISSGDAGSTTDPNQVYANIVNNLNSGGASVVLQHDVKDYSVAAVESVIKYGLEHGYTFAKLDASSFTAHHGVAN